MAGFRLALHWQILAGMIAGAVIGGGLNFFASERFTRVDEGLPETVSAVEIEDTSGRAEIRIYRDGELDRVWLVDPSQTGERVVRSLDELAGRDPQAARLYERYGGSTAVNVGNASRRIGNLFLRMLQMVAVPLIVTSLVSGVIGIGGHGLGRMMGRTVAYYLVTSLLAIVTGLAAVNLFRPGVDAGVVLAVGEASEITAPPRLSEVLFTQLESIIPANPLRAFVEPNFLSIIAFTLAFAIFAVRVGGAAAAAVGRAAEVGFAVMMAMTSAIIRLAPVGVFFLMLYVTATQGIDIFRSLGWYLLTAAAALAFHALVTLPLIVRYVAGRSPREFARAMSPALLTAFSTASSNATLPLTLTCVRDRAGISNRTGSFVLPLGATINMDGTSLYEVVAVLFLGQLYAGGQLPLSSQIIVALTALVAGIGAAGIPHAGLVMMVIILQAVNLPLEMQGLLLAVDRILDMARTAVNVWSDACGCAVVESLEPAEITAKAASSAAANP